MLLHVLNRSPATSEVYRQALAAMGPDDRLLLIEDGVQGAVGTLVARFAGLEGRLYAQEEDLVARGL
ncbi:DsrH/TusB family sulfur metabolism protein, partial [Halomonas sp.]